MRRTYRSKKETSGALDHRDVIQGLDEKASVFDAFYIHNIKQTKRELSCIGSSNHLAPTASKVRKRKYVKRILREVEQPTTSVKESTSTSVFLTPDKSMRVNKAQDLFDQLLNSSSPRQTAITPNNRYKNTKFQPRMEGKTYARRDILKIKKNNCSSDEIFDSDKENSSGSSSSSHDYTDIRSHELLIEKEKKPSQEYMDESINNIFKNISIFNNIHRHRQSTNTPSPLNTSSGNYEDHRLTANFNLSNLSKSPLCSTPFKEKYRGQSIYKFSPIALDRKQVSPLYLTVVEESGNDSVFIDKKNESTHFIEEIAPPSPIIHLFANKSSKSDKSSKTTSKIEFDVTSPIKHVKELSSKVIDSYKKDEISKFQTSEVELFLGFSNIQPCKMEGINIEENYNLLTNSEINKARYNEILLNDNVNSRKKSEEISCNIQIDISKDFSNSQTTENTSYDTCNSEQSSSSLNYKAIDASKIPVVKIEKLSDSILMKYVDEMNTNDSQENCSEVDSDHYASFEDSKSSIPDSKNSTVSNDSENMIDEENNNNDISNTSDVLENSFDDEFSVETSAVNSTNTNIEIDKDTDISQNLFEETIASEIDIHQNFEEDKCISFVTTRRRNDLGNNSMLLGFDSSISSTSSADYDKTVLSINENRVKVKDTVYSNKDNEDCNMNKDTNAVFPKLKTIEIMDASFENSRLSRVTVRKSSRLTSDSNLPSCSTISTLKDTEAEVKPGIVLQPGKKWERSLSIYRRMTMMTDHFDHSILEDEKLQTKGRKYRQSVISTMEMQESRGSLHNESTISRRSTFVSKPCRSTIRIVKEANTSRLSSCSCSISEDLKGFLTEDCDDTVVELSKLSIADSEHEVTVLEHFHDTSNRVPTARDYVLRRCNQADAILFDECYPDAVLKNCHKIGEGVYGEVFLWRAGDGRVRVMKIVPIAGLTKVNGEHQKDFNEIISEIVIAMELSTLRAHIDEIDCKFDEGTTDALDLHSVENATDVFNEVLAVRCVSGSYPSRLLDLWELYDECKGSENDNPAILPVDQQYIVLELANAGQDLESFEFNNAEQAHALFLQVAFGLAVGEEAFEFEHRDLHWGNVLIAPTDQKLATFVLRGRAYRVPRRGVAATIIDYSLSRVALPLSAAGAGERAALYNDLARDDSLFDAVGDYQFEVYRRMRDKLGNDWKNFEPYTNILWLHYTVDKMITALRYKRTNTKIHKHYIAKLKGIKNRILDYGSAAQFVLTDNEF